MFFVKVSFWLLFFSLQFWQKSKLAKGRFANWFLNDRILGYFWLPLIRAGTSAGKKYSSTRVHFPDFPLIVERAEARLQEKKNISYMTYSHTPNLFKASFVKLSPSLLKWKFQKIHGTRWPWLYSDGFPESCTIQSILLTVYPNSRKAKETSQICL